MTSAADPSPFEIKSADLPVETLLLREGDLARLDAALQAEFGPSPDFFDHEAVLVDASALGDGAQFDVSALWALLRRHRMSPVALRSPSLALRQSALAAGIALAADASASRARPVRTVVREVIREVPVEVPVEVRVEVPVSTPEPAPQAALVIDKPLRSGQKVYARGRDLVVLAMVNPGAEVAADGHIHVYAPLRGKAMAGARGNAEARVFALAMAPELVSIAGIYRTSEHEWPPEVQGKPAQVRLDGEKLLFEPL